MKLIFPITFSLLFILLFHLLPVHAHELNGSLSLEARLFVNKPDYPGQEHHNGSLAFAPEYYHELDGGNSFVFTPFLRLDSADPERSHFDIRELNVLLLGTPWELHLGIGKVFWGVTEFVHLVDIINQTDLVEDIRGEEKLGQPMIQLSIPRGRGVFDFFVLPFFRERTFPGTDGRLRSGIVVDTDNPIYENSAEEYHVDVAIRYSRILDSGDIGLYYFRGTGREPLLVPLLNSLNQPVLLPCYQQIDQIGLDLQTVAGNWLWKLEALYQHIDSQSYFAATGGFEYTLFGIGDTLADLGIISEYAFDDRNDAAKTSFQNDLLLGLRLGINDAASTEILVGLGLDLDDKGNVLRVEASRRLSDTVKISLESSAFLDTAPDDFSLFNIRDDDFVRLQVFYYF